MFFSDRHNSVAVYYILFGLFIQFYYFNSQKNKELKAMEPVLISFQ